MDSMHILEGKVLQLIERVRQLHDNNLALLQSNAQLQEKVELLETTLLSRDQSSREMVEMKALVDSLLHSLNEVVEPEADSFSSRSL